MNKKSQLVNWVFVLVLLFFVWVSWFVAVKVFVPVQDYVEPALNDTNTSFSLRALDSVKKVERFNIRWPVFVSVGLIFFGFMSSLRRDPNVFER